MRAAAEHARPIASLPVFFCEEMLANVESMSLSARKPARALKSWAVLGIPLDVRSPAPATRQMLKLAHDPQYVDDVLDCRHENGFGTISAEVADSLPYTNGAMLAAAQEAVRTRSVAIAPCSGFHHAGYSHGGGFCTFNGLMMAALELKLSGLAERIGILDFDQHWGDGTHDIITEKCAEDWIEHYSPIDYGTTLLAESFLRDIPTILNRFAACDVLLYQAGADPHIDDPLGGWLTTNQLRQRDLAVFESMKRLAVPIAWNLAGGYQTPLRKVLDIHDNTLRECWRVFGAMGQEQGMCS